jgi:hypothetical protein
MASRTNTYLRRRARSRRASRRRTRSPRTARCTRPEASARNRRCSPSSARNTTASRSASRPAPFGPLSQRRKPEPKHRRSANAPRRPAPDRHPAPTMQPPSPAARRTGGAAGHCGRSTARPAQPHCTGAPSGVASGAPSHSPPAAACRDQSFARARSSASDAPPSRPACVPPPPAHQPPDKSKRVIATLITAPSVNADSDHMASSRADSHLRQRSWRLV